MSSRRCPTCCICGPMTGPSGPSITSMAKPCTADQARNSAPGRRSAGNTPALTRPSSATPSSWNGSRPPGPALAGSAGRFFQVVGGAKGSTKQAGLRLRKTQIAGAHCPYCGTGCVRRCQACRQANQLVLHGCRDSGKRCRLHDRRRGHFGHAAGGRVL